MMVLMDVKMSKEERKLHSSIMGVWNDLTKIIEAVAGKRSSSHEQTIKFYYEVQKKVNDNDLYLLYLYAHILYKNLHIKIDDLRLVKGLLGSSNDLIKKLRKRYLK